MNPMICGHPLLAGTRTRLHESHLEISATLVFGFAALFRFWVGNARHAHPKITEEVLGQLCRGTAIARQNALTSIIRR
jgi:hypothetical protein